jgi:regulator of protease activity HflC (stomatin/prohibitin superfamily)
MSIVTGMFFYAEPGTAYAVQYPWGSQKAVFQQGINTKMWGRLIPIQFEMPIKYVIPDEDGGFGDQSKYAYVDAARHWEFNDAVKGKIATSIVVSINTTDETQFLSVADRNKTEKNLIRSRIIPNIDQSIKNTCKLMAAQDYISGQAADFDRYFQDQLENGMYVLEEYIENEKPDIIGDSTVVRTVPNKESRQKRFRIKYKNGEPVRVNGNSLKSYGLTVVQAVVNEIDWEETFDTRLQLQKEEVAQTQLEKQQAEREFYRAQKEKAKGEAEKAKERARLEKAQIQQTIAAETEAKVAEFNLVKEKKQYEVEQFKAKSKKVAADAQYYENAKLVSAGLTPQERAEWEYKTAVGVAQQLKELRLPTTYIESGKNGKSGNLLESLIGAELAKKMIEKKN